MKKTKQVWIYAFLCVIAILLIVFLKQDKTEQADNGKVSTEEDSDKIPIEADENHETYNEEICLSFIRQSMSREDGGVYTNYLENDEHLSYSTGHEILSESVGLMMLYYVNKSEKHMFDEQVGVLLDGMLLPNGLVRWRVNYDGDGITETSATIDDLRIIRALIEAYELWGENQYLEYALKIESMIKENNVYEGNIVNYYDQKYDFTAKEVDLSYFDLKTMILMSEYNSEWLEIMENGINIVKDGMISDAFPMYYKTYDIENDEYLNSGKINVIDSFTTILHLSEVDEESKKSIEWIDNQMDNFGVINSSYSCEGHSLSEDESTAAYAIVSRIAKNIGDNDLYNKAMSRMVQLQIKNRESIIYGSFGYEEELEVFSYDNLQALLAFK